MPGRGWRWPARSGSEENRGSRLSPAQLGSAESQIGSRSCSGNIVSSPISMWSPAAELQESQIHSTAQAYVLRRRMATREASGAFSSSRYGTSARRKLAVFDRRAGAAHARFPGFFHCSARFVENANLEEVRVIPAFAKREWLKMKRNGSAVQGQIRVTIAEFHASTQYTCLGKKGDA